MCAIALNAEAPMATEVVEPSRMEVPRTNFIEPDGVSIAWQVFGDGPSEILFIPGWISNVDMFWQFADPREFFTDLGRSARVAVYDKPGTGASDPEAVTPSVEQRIDQLIAVMDAAGLERATVVAVSEGGITGVLPRRRARIGSSGSC